MSRTMSTKDQLLLCLKEEKGSWFPGELLGKRLKISRTAVWKHICALKEEGYIIESSRKKGYALRETPDCLLEREICEGLKNRVIGKRGIVHFNETDSTNIRAEHLADNGAPEGMVVVAERQTQGRGRRGRVWFSPADEGIYASVILRPDIPPNEAPRLTLLTAVAIAEAIRSCTSLPAAIKWPNDIFVGGKKVAGILTEIRAEMDRIHYIVIGLGINVNNKAESYPLDIQDKATSLFIESGNLFSRAVILRTCLECFETQYELFKVHGFGPVMQQWKQLSNVIGKQVSVDVIDKNYIGLVQDIDEDGFLMIRDKEGNLRRIISGDVSLLD
jgi:BirA family biotin operon repressor/biotin-[acetyl-CoA-carboxylase] ligase